MNKLDKYRVTRKREIDQIDKLEMLCIKIDALAESVGAYSKKKNEELDKYISNNDMHAYERYLRAMKYEDTARRELAALQVEFDQFLREKNADYPPQIVALCFLPDISMLPEELQNLIREARGQLGISVEEESKGNGTKPKQQGE